MNKFTRSNSLSIIRIGAITIIVLIIVIYAFTRSFNYISGPELEIISPQNMSTIYAKTSEISGKASRISKILLNGYPISMDESGNWKKTIVVFPGINILTIQGFDKFDRTIEKRLTLWGDLEQTIPVSTSSQPLP
jgi:hypothetical protein